MLTADILHMCSIRGMRRHSAFGRPRRHVSFFDISYEPTTLPTRPSNPLTSRQGRFGGKPGSCAVALVGSADGAIAARPVEATLPPRTRGDRLISLACSAALRSRQRYGIDLQAASAAASRFAN